jgi:hypothetical protein
MLFGIGQLATRRRFPLHRQAITGYSILGFWLQTAQILPVGLHNMTVGYWCLIVRAWAESPL